MGGDNHHQYRDNSNNNDNRDEFGRSAHGSNGGNPNRNPNSHIHPDRVKKIAQMSSDLHQGQQHEDRSYHGNQHQPPARYNNNNSNSGGNNHYGDDDNHHYGRSDNNNYNNNHGNGHDHYGRPDNNNDNNGSGMKQGTVVRGKVVRIEAYGAFVEFRLPEAGDNSHYRGLVHISQMASHRVEKVEDVIQMNQETYAVILEVSGPRNREKIRLSLTGIDQSSGVLTQAPDFTSSRQGGGGGGYGGGGGGRGGGGDMRNFRLLQDRAKQRREMFRDMVDRHDIHWWGDGDGEDHGNDDKDGGDSSSNKRQKTNNNQPMPAMLRLLWSPSPEPPGAAAATKKKDPPKRAVSPSDKDKSKSNSKNKSKKKQYDSESSSGSDSSDSDSEDSRGRRHRGSSSKRKRGGGGGGGRSSRDKGRNSSRRRRSYSSSSSSSSSSSGSDSDSSSGSSSASGSSHSTSTNGDTNNKKKRAKTDDNEDEDPQEAVANGAAADAATGTEMDEHDLKDAQDLKRAVQGDDNNNDDEDDDDFGPAPLPNVAAGGGAAGGQAGSEYGGALLPGEGQAIAQYVQQNLRIPRRGEIGYQGDEIETFENQGYVMSGSRHARMNAVRIRKENQVYSAEEQRALALITMEENQQKEAQLMEDFRTMLKAKKAQAAAGKSDKSGDAAAAGGKD